MAPLLSDSEQAKSGLPVPMSMEPRAPHLSSRSNSSVRRNLFGPQASSRRPAAAPDAAVNTVQPPAVDVTADIVVKDANGNIVPERPPVVPFERENEEDNNCMSTPLPHSIELLVAAI